MFGGLISGTGTVMPPSVDFLIGAVAPGTNGTIGTLTITALSSEHRFVDGYRRGRPANDRFAGDQRRGHPSPGTRSSALSTVQQTDSFVFLRATTIAGAYNAVPTRLPACVSGRDKGHGGAVQPGSRQFPSGVVPLAADHPTTISSGSQRHSRLARGELQQPAAALSGDRSLSTGRSFRRSRIWRRMPSVRRHSIGDMVTTGFAICCGSIMGEMAVRPRPADRNAHRLDGLKMALNSASGGTAHSQHSSCRWGQASATIRGGMTRSDHRNGPAAASSEMMRCPTVRAASSPAVRSAAPSRSRRGGRADVRGFVIGGRPRLPRLATVHGRWLARLLRRDSGAACGAVLATKEGNSLQGAIYARYDMDDNWIAVGLRIVRPSDHPDRRVVVVGGTAFALLGHTGGDAPALGVYVGKSFVHASLMGRW